MIEELFPKVPDRIIKIALIFMMIVLTITISIVGIIIFKYGSLIKLDPCSMCECTLEMVKLKI